MTMDDAGVERAMAHLYGMVGDDSAYQALASAREALAEALGLDPLHPPETLGGYEQVGQIQAIGRTKGMFDPRYRKIRRG